MQNRETPSQKHARIARRFLDDADKYFDDGNIIQVSEKLWGAATHAAKALCIRRGWRHSKYAHIRDAIQRMTDETGDKSIIDGYLIAQSHHFNFYTDAMEPADADPARPRIRELVDKLLTAAAQNPPPAAG